MLDGIPARIVKPTLRRAVQAGKRRFICLPLFLGPSQAITGYLPELFEEAARETPDLQFKIADPLAGPDVEHPDARLAEILVEQVDEVIRSASIQGRPKVALVDHGTPLEAVNRLRNRVAGQLQMILGDRVAEVVATSMERRPGDAYAFNEPLLEHLGSEERHRGGTLVVAMFFLLPGRHAGEDGDVARICEHLIRTGTFERIEKTGLIGENRRLVDILEDRLNATL